MLNPEDFKFNPGALAKFKVDAYTLDDWNGHIDFCRRVEGDSNVGTRVPISELNGHLVEIVCRRTIIYNYKQYRIHLVGRNLYRTVLERRLEPL